MQKQIFSEEDIVRPTETFQAKQIFDEKEVVIEEDLNAYQYLDESEVAEKELLFEEDCLTCPRCTMDCKCHNRAAMDYAVLCSCVFIAQCNRRGNDLPRVAKITQT